MPFCDISSFFCTLVSLKTKHNWLKRKGCWLKEGGGGLNFDKESASNRQLQQTENSH